MYTNTIAGNITKNCVILDDSGITVTSLISGTVNDKYSIVGGYYNATIEDENHNRNIYMVDAGAYSAIVDCTNNGSTTVTDIVVQDKVASGCIVTKVSNFRYTFATISRNLCVIRKNGKTITSNGYERSVSNQFYFTNILEVEFLSNGTYDIIIYELNDSGCILSEKSVSIIILSYSDDEEPIVVQKIVSSTSILGKLYGEIELVDTDVEFADEVFTADKAEDDTNGDVVMEEIELNTEEDSI